MGTMRTIQTPVGPVRYVETNADRDAMRLWIQDQHTIAVDTESTGLDIYASDWKLRMIQLASPVEAWVLPYYEWNAQLILDDLLACPRRLIMHNAGFDIRSIWKKNYELRKKAWAVVQDTRILSHLVDPRGQEEGGTGHSLADLAKVYVPEAPKEGDALKEEFLRLRKAGELLDIGRPPVLKDRFAAIPEDNEVFVRYAGLDAIITARLYKALCRELKDPKAVYLSGLEHKLAFIMSEVDHTGTLIDPTYCRKVQRELQEQEISCKKIASEQYHLQNINSTKQVVEALAWVGINSTAVTPKGNPSVDSSFLAAQSHPLVDAIVAGRRAGKWRKTWVENFLEMSDEECRVHPSTNTLRARTARFSVTGIPVQTLPASDSMIRSCFVAEAGHSWVAVDYSNQELRYAAAVSGDTRMIQAFAKDEDLHLITAEAAFPGRGAEMRKYGKLTNFATIYGVGATGLAKQTGLSVEECRKLLEAFRRSYPTLASFGRSLAGESALTGVVVTATGRRLPVDASRSYSALNYYVQSGCRDITAQAIRNLWDAGFGEYIRLAIHDEIDFSIADGWMPWDEIRECMETEVNGVRLPVEIRVGKRAWGSLYS